MRLGEFWDYFMRRKWLVLSIIVASAAAVFLGCKICFGRTNEIAETSVLEVSEIQEIEIPNTGKVGEAQEIEIPDTDEIAEVAEISLAKDIEAGCVTETVDWLEMTLGGGENGSADDLDSVLGTEITFWGAEAPEAMIKPIESEAVDSEKTETVIIILGILAVTIVLGIGKIVFDRYVR